MPCFPLRPYQDHAVQCMKNHIRFSEEHCYGVAPGGSGKSIMIAAIAEHIASQGKRCVVVARSDTLLHQNQAKLSDPSISGVYCAKMGEKDASKAITFASIQSIYRHHFDFDYMIVDECHNINSEEWGQYWKFYENAGQPQIIGFTATPFRTKGGALRWGREVFAIPIEPLFNKGYIVPPITKVPVSPDLSAIPVRMGDFVESYLEEIFVDKGMYEASVKHILGYGADRESVLIFCQSVKHAEMIAESVGGRHIHGETPKKDRAQILDDFAARKIKYLTNCQLLTEGYDAPQIDMVVLLRSTMSKGLYEQMVLRGTRPNEGKKNFLLVDLGGNVTRHGFLGSPFNGEDGIERQADSVKICPECETAQKQNAHQCSECGYIWPAPEIKQHSHDTEMDHGRAIIQQLDVYDVLYDKHTSKSGNECVKITFLTNDYNSYSDYYAIHSAHDFPRMKFNNYLEKASYWSKSTDWSRLSIENVIAEISDKIKKPHKITVDLSEKFPKITYYDFTEKDIDKILDDEIVF